MSPPESDTPIIDRQISCRSDREIPDPGPRAIARASAVRQWHRRPGCPGVSVDLLKHGAGFPGRLVLLVGALAACAEPRSGAVTDAASADMRDVVAVDGAASPGASDGGGSQVSPGPLDAGQNPSMVGDAMQPAPRDAPTPSLDGSPLSPDVAPMAADAPPPRPTEPGAVIWWRDQDMNLGGISRDRAGNIIVAGSSRQADRGLVLGALSASGQPQWQKDFPGGNSEVVNGVAVGAPNTFTVTGYFSGPTDFGGQIRTASGNSDVFVARYAREGLLATV
jgi:hypothetical protein